MLGRTHRVGGGFFTFCGFLILKKYNYLIPGVAPWLQLVIMYPFCMWGSMAPDLDHHTQSIPMRDAFSIALNKVLHLTHGLYKYLDRHWGVKWKKWYNPIWAFASLFNARHRSYQTHSDLNLFIGLYLLHRVIQSGNVSYEMVTVRLILTGVLIGYLSHVVLDMMTPGGIWSIVGVVINHVVKKAILPTKLRLVPKWHWLRTGSNYEDVVRSILSVGTALMVVYLVYEFGLERGVDLWELVKQLAPKG